MDLEYEEHPIFEPMHKWIADQWEIDPDDLAPRVTDHIVGQVLKTHGGFGDISGTVEVKTGMEQIQYEITIDGQSFTMS